MFLRKVRRAGTRIVKIEEKVKHDSEVSDIDYFRKTRRKKCFLEFYASVI